MEVIHIVALVLLGLFVASASVTLAMRNAVVQGSYGPSMTPKFVVGLVISGALLFALLIVGWMAIGPEYRLWRASIEKRIAVEEARATADSAIELARAEVERAKGTAEANIIVAESITEPYLRYLYIINIADTDNQIIYLPTEAGLPILEADRFRQDAGR